MELRAVMLVVLAGCAAKSSATTSPPKLTSAPLDDGQTVAILQVIDTQQILTAQLAVERASTAETRAFAEQVLLAGNADRTRVLGEAHHAHAEPESSLLIDLIEKPARVTRAELSNETGVSFDHFFLVNEIAQKQKEIDWVDHMLLPAVHSNDLKTELAGRRANAINRIREARRLDEALPPNPAHF
jgi:predicted outer membrane protein